MRSHQNPLHGPPRRLLLIVALAWIGLLLGSTASAGTLTSVSLEFTFHYSDATRGQATLTAATSGGSSGPSGATWAGGLTGTVNPPPVAFGDIRTVIVTTANPLQVSAGGAVSGGVIRGDLCRFILALCGVRSPLLLGSAATLGSATSFFGFQVGATGQGWTTGPLVATGTGSGAPITVTTTGSYGLTAGGAGSLSLVTSSVFHYDGAAIGMSAARTLATARLQLHYVPEPSLALFLALLAPWLVVAGRTRRS